MKTLKKLWIWNWVGGGYNSCRADTREEAIAKANEFSEEAHSILKKESKRLILDEKTLHEGTSEELRKLDREYGFSWFD